MVVPISAIQVLALACLGVWFGNVIKRRVGIIDRLNVPGPIAGGLVLALAVLGLRDRGVILEFDTSLQPVLMVAFFTTIGMSASTRLIRLGGRPLLVFFAIATVGAVLQNLAGVGVGTLLGLDPRLGLIAGSVALTGGPATALAFGGAFEAAGVAGASSVGLAAAMVGITAGGLLGGYLGGGLIERHGLAPRPGPANGRSATTIAYGTEPLPEPASHMQDESYAEEDAWLANAVAIGVAMGIGSLVSLGFERLGLVLPATVGAMLVAAVLRNIDERRSRQRLAPHILEALGNIALQLFIAMALLTLQLWQLVHLALPLLVLLAAQVALTVVMCRWLVFRFMGRDYEAAVMTGGFCGFMLGTTANAMACMTVLTQKHGAAPRAFLVVPLVGAFLIDFANTLVITGFMNVLR